MRSESLVFAAVKIAVGAQEGAFCAEVRTMGRHSYVIRVQNARIPPAYLAHSRASGPLRNARDFDRGLSARQ